MADQATTEDDATAAETADPTEQQTKTEVPPEVKAALRKANKEAETLRLKLQEFEDRDKSEAQKLAERATAAEERAAGLETKALRLEIAAEKGLTPAQAKRLVGSTREELESDATELLETFKTPGDQKVAEAATSFDLGTRGNRDTPSGATPAADFAKWFSAQRG